MPAIFAAQGAPVLLDDREWMAELVARAQATPKQTFPTPGWWMDGAFM